MLFRLPRYNKPGMQVTCALFLYNKRFDWRTSGTKISHVSLLLVFIFSLLSTFSMAFGLMTMPFVLFVSLLRGANRKELLFIVLLTALLFFIYGIGMNLSPSTKTEWHLYAFDLFRILYFSVIMLGSLFIANIQIALVIGATLMLITVAVSIALLKSKQSNSSELNTLYCLVILAVVYGIMVGIGRRHSLDEYAMTSRYMLTAAIYWQGMFVLSMYFGIKFFPNAKHILLSVFSVVLMPVIIATFIQYVVKYDFVTRMIDKSQIAVTALQVSLLDMETFPSLQIVDIDEFYSLASSLKVHKTSIYGTEIAKFYDQKINTKYMIDNNRCIGGISEASNPPVIKQLVNDSAGMGLKLSGWTKSNQTGVNPPSKIFLVDQNGVIKGTGFFPVKRSSTAISFKDPVANSSKWIAFARLDKKATEINVYSLNEKDNVLCLIKSLDISSTTKLQHMK